MSLSLYKDHTDLKIIKLLNITNKFIKNNPNIIFNRADKENITVALNRTDYINKIEDMLKDIDTYNSPVNKNPIRKFTNDF